MEYQYGDRLELDWAGDTYRVVVDGKILNYNIMVLTWSASYYTFARLVPNLTTKSTIEGLRESLTAIGYLPSTLVIDNAKSMVIKHVRGHEPILQSTFKNYITECGLQISANNPRQPNLKSAVERSVELVQRRVFKSSVMQFLSGKLTVEEANLKVMELVESQINQAPFRDDPINTRAKLFHEYETLASHKITYPLPNYKEYRKLLLVALDYHVDVDGTFYSVPYKYAGKTVDATICEGIVSIYCQGKEIASHPVVTDKKYQTQMEHLPKHHKIIKTRELKYKCKEDIINESKKISPIALNACLALLSKGSFEETKAGAIYVISLYKKNNSFELRTILDAAVDAVLHDVPKDKLHSTIFNNRFTDFLDFARTHGGHVPIQTQLPFDSISNQSITNPQTAFIRDSSTNKSNQINHLDSTKDNDDLNKNRFFSELDVSF